MIFNKITVIRQEGAINNNYPFAVDIHYFQRPTPTRLPVGHKTYIAKIGDARPQETTDTK